jgi:hypothetical protein
MATRITIEKVDTGDRYTCEGCCFDKDGCILRQVKQDDFFSCETEDHAPRDIFRNYPEKNYIFKIVSQE